MKTFLLTFLFISAIYNNTTAQHAPTVPRTEFTITVSTDVLELKPGDSSDVTVSLTRSKGFAKAKATLCISSTLPEDVKISFDQTMGQFDKAVAHVTTSNATKAGTYIIILNCQMNHKNKAATLKLVVKDSNDYKAGI